jgi:hypothetical protein
MHDNRRSKTNIHHLSASRRLTASNPSLRHTVPHGAQASPDLLRSMVQTFAEALMGAEAGAVCGDPRPACRPS